MSSVLLADEPRFEQVGDAVAPGEEVARPQRGQEPRHLPVQPLEVAGVAGRVAAMPSQ